jgi:hypothetical protein
MLADLKGLLSGRWKVGWMVYSRVACLEYYMAASTVDLMAASKAELSVAEKVILLVVMLDHDEVVRKVAL